MFEIYLIRPGETDFDAQGRILGTLDVPLSEAGRVQVEAAVAKLRDKSLDAVYAAPCQSAKETGKELAAALGIKCKSLDRLANIDMGLWQGMLVEQVRTKQPKVYRMWQERPESVRPPEGEMLAAAKDRVAEAIARLTKKHKEGAIAVVAPDPLAKLIAQAVSPATPLGNLWANSNCGSCEVFTVLGAPSGTEA